MKKSYDKCVKALNIAFGLYDNLASWRSPDTQTLREAATRFPLLHSMAQDLSPDITTDDSLGMVAALTSSYQSLSMEYPDIFEGSPPNMDDLVAVDELLAAEDDGLRERVIRMIPPAEALFTGGLTDKQGGFLIGFCVMVNWVNDYVPEDMFDTSDDVGHSLTDAESPPEFSSAPIDKEALVDAYEIPKVFDDSSKNQDASNIRAVFAQLLSVSSDIHITLVGQSVLLIVSLSSAEIETVTTVAAMIAKFVPVSKQYVSCDRITSTKITLVSELK
jgi:hypothetical protein